MQPPHTLPGQEKWLRKALPRIHVIVLESRYVAVSVARNARGADV